MMVTSAIADPPAALPTSLAAQPHPCGRFVKPAPPGSGTPCLTEISGTSCATRFGNDTLPRGANAIFVAAFVLPAISEPDGGPPQIPRCGLAHAIGPVHWCRMM